MNYGTNTGLIILKNNEGIIINSTNNHFKRIVKTSDDELVWNLLKFLKNPKNKEEIKNFIGKNSKQTNKLIETSLQNNLIVKDPISSSNKFFRLERLINTFPNTNFKQYIKKAKNTPIMILGLGTAGSYTLEFLSKLGFDNFILIDGDVVEEKNIIAQNYLYKDINLKKVNVLKRRYSQLNITIIDRKINNYTEIEQLLEKYHPKYLLSNADDGKLVIEILSNIFKKHKDIKILETGYNVAETQFELIDINNYEFYVEKFKEIQEYFLKDPANILVDNTGTIFHAYASAFFSSKYIFDDISQIGNVDWGRFNFRENKYYLDNRFYWGDFQKYIFRYREDSEGKEVESPNVFFNKFDENINLFLASPVDFRSFELLKSISLKNPSAQDKCTIEDVKKLLIEYGSKKLNQKIIPTHTIINNNILFISNITGRTIKNYSEKVNPLENRIYISSTEENIIVNYIHETFHTLLFNITDNTYFHEEFVMKNMIGFCQFLKDKENKYWQYITYLIITYIQGYYLDDFIIVNYEKSLFLNDHDFWEQRMDISETKLNSNEEIIKYIHEKTNHKPPFYFLKYTQAVEKNYSEISNFIKNIQELIQC